jgi:hypothetical protein
MKEAKSRRLRSISLLVCLIVLSSAARAEAAISDYKFIATAGPVLFRNSAAGYRQLYGTMSFMPEIKLTCLSSLDISAWFAAGLFADNGLIEEVEEEATFQELRLSFGIGYARKVNAKLRLRGELGIVGINFKEKALAMVHKGSVLGWQIGVSLDYLIKQKLFLFLTFAYSQASDEVLIGKIELGGAQAGIGLGYDF